MQTKIQQMVEEHENKVVGAKAQVMVAEMNQDDKYTKRGRPTILYGGLPIIFLNHVLFPAAAWLIEVFAAKAAALPNLQLPDQFWWAWGGVCSIYVLDRSAEKMGGTPGGVVGTLFGAVTGKMNPVDKPSSMRSPFAAPAGSSKPLWRQESLFSMTASLIVSSASSILSTS
jgi:hypothetical protein